MYVIEQYELHTTRFMVVADSPALAIEKLLDSEGSVIDDSTKYIGVADRYGMSAMSSGFDHDEDMVKELTESNICIEVDGDTIIPSIRSISQRSDS